MPAAPQPPEKTPVTDTDKDIVPPSHISGCAIFLIILFMVIFFFSFFTWSYFKHRDAMIDMSDETEVPTPIASDSGGAFTKLDQKMGVFSQLVKDKKEARISFSKEELNLAIAHYEKLSAFRGTLFVTEIDDSHIICQITYEVDPGFNAARYLNGTMKLRPVIAQAAIFPIADEINLTNGSPVPAELTQNIPTLLFSKYRNEEDEDFKAVFLHLSTVTLEGGKMVITSDPSKIDPDAIPDDVTMETNRALQLFGLFGFIFATTLAFMLWYRKYKKGGKVDSSE